MEQGFKSNKLRSAMKTPPFGRENVQDVGFALLEGIKCCMEVSNVAGLLQRLDSCEDLLEQVSVVG
jgi:hypothetical protein